MELEIEGSPEEIRSFLNGADSSEELSESVEQLEEEEEVDLEVESMEVENSKLLWQNNEMRVRQYGKGSARLDFPVEAVGGSLLESEETVDLFETNAGELIAVPVGTVCQSGVWIANHVITETTNTRLSLPAQSDVSDEDSVAVKLYKDKMVITPNSGYVSGLNFEPLKEEEEEEEENEDLEEKLSVLSQGGYNGYDGSVSDSTKIQDNGPNARRIRFSPDVLRNSGLSKGCSVEVVQKNGAFYYYLNGKAPTDAKSFGYTYTVSTVGDKVQLSIPHMSELYHVGKRVRVSSLPDDCIIVHDW